MQTRKPISTISFNTETFLAGKLQELTRNGMIEYWSYIKHLPEDDEVNDEAGHKEHFHVYVEPARQIQTTALREQFKEPDPVVGKPKGCLQFRTSRFDDWYLYAIHDPAYLASKKQSRVWTYTSEQIISSDEDDFKAKVADVDVSDRNTYLTMWSYIVQGRTWIEYMIAENVNTRDAVPQKVIWQEMSAFGHLNRNGRNGHPNEYIEDVEGVEEIKTVDLPKIARSELPKIDTVSLMKQFSKEKEPD